ncbi:MAG: hypothetical protein IMZ64_14825 [Bacteroidetes bacterium]|nr:hypothetical protein [Bacteroidota bacterium]
MAFQKGKRKTGGREKGVENRTTKEAREILDKILFAELDNIADALKEVRDKSKGDYIEMLAKLLAYVLPKKTDITSDDKPIAQLPTIILKTHDD